MSSKPFLVTGANGSIGRNVIVLLFERDHNVRASVHKNNKHSSQLQQLGAEIAVGDLIAFMTMRPALAPSLHSISLKSHKITQQIF